MLLVPWQSWGWALLAALAALLPATELAVGLVNHVVTKVVPPNTLPKLDFSNGIPAECATFVVIPTLLTSVEGTANLVERLETHYLSNPDPQLRFALLTDLGRRSVEHLPADESVGPGGPRPGSRRLNKRGTRPAAHRCFSCFTGAANGTRPSRYGWGGNGSAAS